MKKLAAVLELRVYGVGESAAVIPPGDYQGLVELKIQDDQFLANVAGL